MRNQKINDSHVPASDKPEGPVWRTPSGGYTGDFDAAQQSVLKQRQADAVAAGEGVVEFAGRQARALLMSRQAADATVWQDVMGAIPQELSSRLSVAREALADIEGKLGIARVQLSRLSSNEGRPRSSEDVQQWAQRKAELVAYVQGYTPYVETAREQCETVAGELHAWLMGEFAERVKTARAHTADVEAWAAQVTEKTQATAEDARLGQQALEYALSRLTTEGTRAIRFDLMPTIDTTNKGGK